MPGKRRNDPTAVLQAVGAELRAARELAGLSQDQIAQLMGWHGRDTMSKMERGLLNISLAEFLRLIRFMDDHLPKSHPAIALAKHYARLAAKKLA